MSVVSVDQVHQLTYFIAAKQLSGFPSPQEFNSYCNLAQSDLYNYYNDERNKQLVRVKTGESIYVPDVLNNFVVDNLPMTFVGNSASFPNDYLETITLNRTVGASGNIIKVDLDELPQYIKSTIDAPTIDNPIFVELVDGLQVFPNINPAYLTYYREPKQVVWAYTLVNGRPQFDATNSVDFEFESTEYYRLCSRILGYMGLSIRDDTLTQMAQEMTNTAS